MARTRRGTIRTGIYVLLGAVGTELEWPDDLVAAYIAEALPEADEIEALRLLEWARSRSAGGGFEALGRLVERDPDLAAITLLYVSKLPKSDVRHGTLVDYELMARAYTQPEIAHAARTLLDREAN